MSFESEENENAESQLVEEEDSIFELIRKVEALPFIYNCRDPKHSKRDVISAAWKSIASGLMINGKEMGGEWCRKRWKSLRDYYYTKKRSMKGKSGDGGKNKKPWTYFSAMDRVLSSYNEENENTQSNFPGVDSGGEEENPEVTSDGNRSTDEQLNNDGLVGTESTRASTPSIKRVQKRKSDANEDLLHVKILKVLEEPEEVKDQFYHFGMTICNRLRNVPVQTAEYAMIRISSLLYELTYPVGLGTTNNYTDHASANESTHLTQL